MDLLVADRALTVIDLVTHLKGFVAHSDPHLLAFHPTILIVADTLQTQSWNNNSMLVLRVIVSERDSGLIFEIIEAECFGDGHECIFVNIVVIIGIVLFLSGSNLDGGFLFGIVLDDYVIMLLHYLSYGFLLFMSVCDLYLLVRCIDLQTNNNISQQ